MTKRFEFETAEPLLAFISQHRDKLVGQHIRRFYTSSLFGVMAATPIAFELDDYSVVISYDFYSDMTLYVVDTEKLQSDLSLNFLYRDVPESRNLETWVFEEEFPYIGQTVRDVRIHRFSSEFVIDPSTGKTRPAGGDYFSVITVVLSSGEEFHICACAPICDGGIEIW